MCYNFAVIWRGSIVRPNARAWRAREPKGSEGSNPSLSAQSQGSREGALFLYWHSLLNEPICVMGNLLPFRINHNCMTRTIQDHGLDRRDPGQAANSESGTVRMDRFIEGGVYHTDWRGDLVYMPDHIATQMV